MQKDVKELVLTIVKPLVTQPDEVSLELIEGEEFMEYHLKVAEVISVELSDVKVGLFKQFAQWFTLFL